MTSEQRRVIVVGAGNAALCAAMSAREQGAEVLVLEKAPEAERGGNTYFTGGGFRFPYDGMPDIQQLIPDLSAAEIARVDVGAYPAAQFRDDLARVTEGLIDDGLATQLVREAAPTLRWLRERGVRFTLMTGRQANEVDGVLVFYGGLTVEAVGAGKGLSDQEFAAAERIGVEVRYGAKVTGLLRTGVRVSGVRVWTDHGEEEIAADAVVLAAGGFEANAEMRTRYLGPGWDLAKVRGSRFNTGDAIRAALELGAQPFGHWSGAHAVAWDLNAPPTGNRVVADLYQKHSYPYGIIVNLDGQRFVDEGADVRNYTYAKYGREILKQPGRVAFQIFDQQTVGLLRDEYRVRQVTMAEPTRSPTSPRISASPSPASNEPSPTSTPPASAATSTPRCSTACAPKASSRPSRTGRCPSPSRPISATPSPAASPSPSAASRSTPAPARCSTPRSAPWPASTPPASWSAASSTTTTPAAPA